MNIRYKPYLAGFRLALSTELVYRLNFIFGRLRGLIVFIALLFLYTALPHGAGAYDQAQLATYAIVSAFVSALLFVFGMNNMANEIAEGDLTNYLLRPVNYFGFWAARMLASRTLLLMSGICEVFILITLFPAFRFVWQTNVFTLFWFVLMTLGAIVIVQLFDFIGATLSFWTHRSYGPRWLITILVQFLSGAYLPIDILPSSIQRILAMTPLPSLVYTPAKIYLGTVPSDGMLRLFTIQLAWIFILGCVLAAIWKRGVQRYEASGR